MSEKKILYLGLDPKRFEHKGELFHYPVIRISARPTSCPHIQKAFQQLPLYTHIIFTSRSAIPIYLHLSKTLNPKYEHLHHQIIAVGSSTAQCAKQFNFNVQMIAKTETAEGIIEEIKKICPLKASFFWPHSSLARPILSNFFLSEKITFHECCIYDTIEQKPLPIPNIELFDEIVFTSPSTVHAFLKIFHNLPSHKKLTPIGPITKHILHSNMG